MTWPLLHEAVIADEPSRQGRCAVAWTNGRLSHDELRRSTLRIASRLAAFRIGRGHRVALCLPKSVEAVQAILGVLASGATYVPVDSTAPAARIKYIVADSQASLLLTTESLRARLAAETATELAVPMQMVTPGTGHGLDAWLAGATERPLPVVGLDDTAAILYTSGSTGQPKGVMLSHRNVSCFVQWAIERFHLGPDDRFTSHAPFHFDLSTLDLFASLRAGGSVYLLDEKAVRFPATVARVLEQEKITVWYSVPTALCLLLESGALAKRDVSALRLVFFAGEVFPVPRLRALMQEMPRPQYVNLYGPTETNVCTYHVMTGPPEPTEQAVPIGIACEHLEVTIRSAEGAVLGVDQTGEICVAGPGAMQGYWRQPEMTDRSRCDGRIDSYRTGDFGHWQPDGTIRFLGRRDHQIKIRGHRLDLLEVESQLMQHPQVRQAAAVLLRPQQPDAQLAAVVASLPGDLPTSASLLAHCARRLPGYAVPSAFIVREDLPHTSTGKVDRRLLTEWAANAVPGASAPSPREN